MVSFAAIGTALKVVITHLMIMADAFRRHTFVATGMQPLMPLISLMRYEIAREIRDAQRGVARSSKRGGVSAASLRHTPLLTLR